MHLFHSLHVISILFCINTQTTLIHSAEHKKKQQFLYENCVWAYIHQTSISVMFTFTRQIPECCARSINSHASHVSSCTIHYTACIYVHNKQRIEVTLFLLLCRIAMLLATKHLRYAAPEKLYTDNLKQDTMIWHNQHKTPDSYDHIGIPQVCALLY